MAASHTELNELLKTLQKPHSLSPTSADEMRERLHRLLRLIDASCRTSAPAAVDLPAVAQALTVLAESHASRELAEVFWRIGMIQLWRGEMTQGMRSAEIALLVARAQSNELQLARVLGLCGMFEVESGDIQRALDCFTEALDLSKRRTHVLGQCANWVNLGVAMLVCAQYKEAIACFGRALDLANREGDARWQSFARSNTAFTLLLSGDISEGLVFARKACEISVLPGDIESRRVAIYAQLHCTCLLLEVGSFADAREQCRVARAMAERASFPRERYQVAAVEALCDVFEGQHEAGLSRMRSALANLTGVRTDRQAIRASLVRAYEFVGKHDLALLQLRELTNDSQQSQQQYLELQSRRMLDALTLPNSSESLHTVLAQREAELRGRLTEQIAQQELARMRFEMFERLAVTAELRDDSTGEHVFRVGRLCALLAQVHGCDEAVCRDIELAARLHDLGKSAIPDKILLKAGALSEGERSLMQNHCRLGAELLGQSNLPLLQLAEDIAIFHHEAWDGSGYPLGAGGTATPLAARMCALADSFDALTHARPYRAALTLDQALQEIAAQRGKRFDPALTDCFLSVIARLRTEVGDRVEALDTYLGQAASQSPFLNARKKILATLQQAEQMH